MYKSACDWVLRLMRKIMQVLGMKPVDDKDALTQDFMRKILMRMMKQAHKDAQNAVRKL